jgi:hypothetical protein
MSSFSALFSLAYLISSFSFFFPLHIRTTIIKKFEKMSKKMAEMRTIPAPILMPSSGVASEKMKMAIMRAE